MVRLHDKTRRWICRGAFLLLGALPTFGVAAWCTLRHLPGAVSAEARRLERLLGLKVSLEGFRHLRPGSVLYEQLELADPETGRTVLRARAVRSEWQETADPQGRAATTLTLVASQPEAPGGPGRLGELLSRLLRGRIGRTQIDLRMAAGQLAMDLPGGSQTLTGLRTSVNGFPQAVEAKAEFGLAGHDGPEPIRIRVVRDRQTTPPATGFELDTGGQEVPCRLLAQALPGLEALGRRSRFRGYLWARQTHEGGQPAGWEGELAGQLLDVDLDGLVTARFPHQLGGTGQLTVGRARFGGGRLEQAAGVLTAGPGTISRSLLDAAARHLGCAQGQGGWPPDHPVPYERLAVAFLIDSDGLRLEGRCGSPAAGAVVADGQGGLLGPPAEQPLPVAALVRTLLPSSRHQVPAARQAAWLISRLPLPEGGPPGEPRAELPQARLPHGGQRPR